MSAIELLHPRGVVRSAIVIGECPARLRPAAPPPPKGERPDLVIVGKDAAADIECADDGIAYMLGRRRAARAVEFVHLPNYAESTHVATLESDALPETRRARIARVSRGRLLCDTGTLLFGPTAEPLAWLQEDVRRVTITTSWHGATSTAVVRGTGKVAKVGAGPSTVPAGLGEAAALRTLGPAAAAAGAEVPRLLDELELDGVPVTIETVVPGRPAAETLRRNEARARELIARLTDWLVRWNARTSDGTSVSVHQDLTMTNVLLTGDALGIVDWASARPDGLPLTDFFYAALDARAAVDGYRDRGAAFRECFLGGGDWYELVGGLERMIVDELSLAHDAADRAFHECWDQHAANETRRGEGTQFRDVARLAAAVR